MEIIAYLSIAYLGIRLIVALVNLVSWRSQKFGKPLGKPFISILIPARNEEKNIGSILDDLQRVDYKDVEILVYDDDSEDGTAEVIRDKILSDKRIKYLHGSGPPLGWLGKNFACDQLARQAKGDYFLFLDADVRLNPRVLDNSLAWMEKHQLALFSIFPVQIMKTPGEWFTVPIVNRILVGNLPLIRVRKSRIVDFAAANGQFMMFDAEIYKNYWFHEQFRLERAEDIQILRMLKKKGHRVDTILSGGQVSCRMYMDYKQGIDGFSKNIHAFFGKNWLILLLYNLITTLGIFAVLMTFSKVITFIYLATLIGFCIVVSIQSRQSVWKNIIFMPFQQFSVVLISVIAAYRNFAGGLSWKGRKI